MCTTGLTGATDCNMVLNRERGKDEATLHITGRDVEEQELQLLFSTDSAQWMLQGKSDRQGMSKEQCEMLSILESSDGPVSPIELSKKLAISASYGRKIVHDLVKMGRIYQVRRGLYAMVTTEVEEKV